HRRGPIPKNRLLYDRATLYGTAIPQHGVDQDFRSSFDLAVVPDDNRIADFGRLVDVTVLTDPDELADLRHREIDRDPAGEAVDMGLPVDLQVADVLPITGRQMAIKGASLLQHLREKGLAEQVKCVFRDEVEHVRLKDID